MRNLPILINLLAGVSAAFLPGITRLLTSLGSDKPTTRAAGCWGPWRRVSRARLAAMAGRSTSYGFATVSCQIQSLQTHQSDKPGLREIGFNRLDSRLLGLRGIVRVSARSAFLTLHCS
ncbi:hypothetical protein V8F20_004254 [Naviculisporaceae sp. PSN 640]